MDDGASDEDFQTQGFEPHESDKEQLWDVIAIHGEKNGRYLIQWAGADANGNPWPDSWIPREDVTDDLVETWKREKARKLIEKRKRKRQGFSVSASRNGTNSKRSTTTTSTVTPRRSTRASSSAITTVRGESASVSTIRSSPVRKRRQRTPSDDDNGSLTVEEDLPRKRRKAGSDNIPRRVSPRKQSVSRVRESKDDVEENDDEGPDVRTPSERQHPRSGKRREESEDEPSMSVIITNADARHARPGRLSSGTEPKPRKAIVHEHEEEEEEEDDGSVIVIDSSPVKPRAQKLEVVVDIPVSPKSKGKSRDQGAGQAAFIDGPSDDQRILDRRPTPPRCTLAKSSPRRTENAVSAISFYDGPTNKKKRKGPPGVRPADLTRERLSGTGEDPSLPIVDTTEDRPRSLSIEVGRNGVMSSSEPRQGLRARMKGKEKADSYDGELGTTSRAATPDRTSQPKTYDDERVETKKVDSVQESSTTHVILISDPVRDEPDFAQDADDGGGYDYDNALDPAPFSQDEPISVDAGVTKDAVPSANVDDATVQESGVVRSGEEQSEDPQSSNGTVIPPTQSQSQSQSQSQPQPQNAPQNSTQTNVNLVSVLAEHGSAPLDAEVSIDADTRPPAAKPVHSSEAEIQPAAFSSSLTDPEPSAVPNGKVLKKIPVVTPSKIRPYLPQQRPLSALPPPHLAPPLSNDEPTSSLESPVKEFDEHTQGEMHDAVSADSQPPAEEEANAEIDDIEDEMPQSLEFRQRVLKLAEIQRRRVRETIQRPVTRVPLDELLERSDRDSTSGMQSSRSEKSNPSGSDDEDDEEARVRRFEEDFIDFDGNAGATSTASRSDGSFADDDAKNGAADEEGEEEYATPEVDVVEEADVEESLQDVDEEDDPFLSRGKTQERETTPTTTSSQQDDVDLPYTPIRSRFKILGSPAKLESPVTQTPARQLNEAMGLLHAKSEEIEFLKRKLAESEKKRLSQDDALAELQAENAVLKKTLDDKEVAQEPIDEKTTQGCREKEESLEKELEARNAELKLVQMSKEDAAKQMEIFREMYGKASSYADEKKQENAELEERARLAEGQVKLGLELIRRQYTAREQALNEELKRQRTLMHVMLTRDQRTDDEVRRRAALEPELREKIDGLQEEIRDLETTQANIIHQRNELLVEKHELNEQLDEMRTKYNKAVEDMSWLHIQVARLTAREKAFKKVFLTTSAAGHENESDRAEERVYVCKWMTGYDGRTRCNSLFTKVQELKDHLFVDHQL